MSVVVRDAWFAGEAVSAFCEYACEGRITDCISRTFFVLVAFLSTPLADYGDKNDGAIRKSEKGEREKRTDRDSSL